jgi:hypothetical protein
VGREVMLGLEGSTGSIQQGHRRLRGRTGHIWQGKRERMSSLHVTNFGKPQNKRTMQREINTTFLVAEGSSP